MRLVPFVLPPLENNNYLLIDDASKEAVLVDCSHYSKKVLDLLTDQGLTLKYILLTHAHFDHILGVERMAQETGATVILHENDEQLLNKLNSYTQMMGMPDVNVPKVDKLVKDGFVIKLGDLEIKTIYTPGHTQGGCSFLCEGKLFSGDTLFKESIGRTDLEGGDFTTLKESIEDKIYILPEDTEVYPGHGPFTTVGHEKKFNSYI